ncbi:MULTISPECIES: alpha/beta fold hydrolase [Polymorphospora]|uniref:Alpha/beta fold hydrolase n=1 Tax=Polymorphospora lycopeni TaxID=3140240 RepID=A0ABV5D1E0_9ACTN
MTEFVTSADGTRIAFDVEGDGPPVILIGGAMQFRAFDPDTVQLAHRLAARGFTVVNYDRRGRGESGAGSVGALESEIDDLAALVGRVGGRAALYGSSSGAVIALWAAQAGVGATRLALWEAPLALEGQGDGGETLRGLRERIAAGDHEGAVEFFMRDMPPEWLAGSKAGPAWPVMVGIAPSLVADAAALTRAQEAPWARQWSAVDVPVLAIVGERTLPLFPPAAAALVAALPRARRVTVPGTDHGWQLDAMTDTLAGFLTD